MLPSFSEAELYDGDPTRLWIGVSQPIAELLACYHIILDVIMAPEASRNVFAVLVVAEDWCLEAYHLSSVLLFTEFESTVME